MAKSKQAVNPEVLQSVAALDTALADAQPVEVAAHPVDKKEEAPKKAKRAGTKKEIVFARGQAVYHQGFGIGSVMHDVTVLDSQHTVAIAFENGPQHARAKDLKRLPFGLHGRVFNKRYGYGAIAVCPTAKKVVQLRVEFDAQGDAPAVTKFYSLSSAERDLVRAEDVKKPLSPVQVLKRVHDHKLNDLVMHNGREAYITGVAFKQQHSHDLLLTLGQKPDEVSDILVQPKDVQKVKLIERFRDVSLFGAFEVKTQTFVKVGNSTAIAVAVRGSIDEPFAMLTTGETKLGKNAKRSFKQTDKVRSYTGQA